jgi:hypothetical protein
MTYECSVFRHSRESGNPGSGLSEIEGGEATTSVFHFSCLPVFSYKSLRNPQAPYTNAAREFLALER